MSSKPVPVSFCIGAHRAEEILRVFMRKKAGERRRASTAAVKGNI